MLSRLWVKRSRALVPPQFKLGFLAQQRLHLRFQTEQESNVRLITLLIVVVETAGLFSECFIKNNPDSVLSGAQKHRIIKTKGFF